MTSPAHTQPAATPPTADNSRLNLPLISNNFSRSKAPIESRASDDNSTRVLEAATKIAHTEADSSTVRESLSPKNRSEVEGDRHAMKEHNNPQRISYANVIKPVATRKPDVLVHRCAVVQPVVNNGVISIKIPETMYQERIKQFQHALIGRVLLRKGEKPRLTSDLKKELQVLWQPKSDWKLIPMSKGFYTLKFTTAEDKLNSKRKNSWSLASGTLRIRDWVRNFDPYKEISSICQVWMRIYYLPVEYWTKEIISSIGNSVGVPIKVDGATADGDVGHFARVLVEVDLALPLPDSVHVDCPDQSFYVEIGFEQLPHFCTKCKITGHSLDNCFKKNVEKGGKQSKKPMEGDVGDTNKEKSKSNEDLQFRKPRTVWHTKTDKETEKPSENRFNVLNSQHVSEPVEVGTIPAREKEAQRIEQELIAADLTSDEEEMETIEMEQNPNNLRDAQQTNQPDTDMERDLEPTVEETNTADTLDKGQTDSVLSETKARNRDEADITVNQTANLEQIKNAEGADKNKETLKTAKKRGRPPGQTRAERKPDLSTDNIKGRLRRPPHMRAEPNEESMELIKNQLYKAWEAGGTPREFVITNEGSSSAKVMTKVAAKTWAEEVEREESLATTN
ncbi:uncharacterized protein LOC131009784 [Salvia miltiorrhiza]|uniref:uncharacterized protein LOC131009784 n=1 Tax=Salvia miltiorrhiza TaxID=226208 RepID=UPI0025ABCEC8|nr:uncharacterized protein LOC131009784 [Salvia miltiorrhiza]